MPTSQCLPAGSELPALCPTPSTPHAASARGKCRTISGELRRGTRGCRAQYILRRKLHQEQPSCLVSPSHSPEPIYCNISMWGKNRPFMHPPGTKFSIKLVSGLTAVSLSRNCTGMKGTERSFSPFPFTDHDWGHRDEDYVPCTYLTAKQQHFQSSF